jgi:hypothetical protein
MAMLFSIGASGATRQEAMAAKTAARTGGGANSAPRCHHCSRRTARRPQSDVGARLRAQDTGAARQPWLRVGERVRRRPAEPARAARGQGTQGRQAACHRGFGPRTRRGAGRHVAHQRAQVHEADPGHGARRFRDLAGRSLVAIEPGAPRKWRQRSRCPHRRVVRQLRLRPGRVRAGRAVHARRAGHRQQRPAARRAAAQGPVGRCRATTARTKAAP